MRWKTIFEFALKSAVFMIGLKIGDRYVTPKIVS